MYTVEEQKERRRESRRRYRLANHGKLIDVQRRYRQGRREEIAEYNRKYYQSHGGSSVAGGPRRTAGVGRREQVIRLRKENPYMTLESLSRTCVPPVTREGARSILKSVGLATWALKARPRMYVCPACGNHLKGGNAIAGWCPRCHSQDKYTVVNCAQCDKPIRMLVSKLERSKRKVQYANGKIQQRHFCCRACRGLYASQHSYAGVGGRRRGEQYHRLVAFILEHPEKTPREVAEYFGVHVSYMYAISKSANLRMNTRAIHPRGYRKYGCRVCGRRISKKYLLTRVCFSCAREAAQTTVPCSRCGKPIRKLISGLVRDAQQDAERGDVSGRPYFCSRDCRHRHPEDTCIKESPGYNRYLDSLIEYFKYSRKSGV